MYRNIVLASLGLIAIFWSCGFAKNCDIASRYQVASRGISFAVSRSTAYSSPQYANIPMTSVTLNDGLGWNSTSNSFIAPVKGVYVFSFAAANSGGGIMYVYSFAGSSRVEIRAAGDGKQSSETYVALLEKGQAAVFIAQRGVKLSACAIPCTAFSGFLLYPLL